jgi:hypothetical protein
MTQKANKTKSNNNWDKVDFSLGLPSCANKNHETNTFDLFMHGSLDWWKLYHCCQKLVMFTKRIQIDFIVGNGNLQQGNMIVKHLNLLVYLNISSAMTNEMIFLRELQMFCWLERKNNTNTKVKYISTYKTPKY